MKKIKKYFHRFQKSKLYKRIFRNLSISLLGMVGGMVMSLGRVSLLTKSLSVADYGRVLITTTLFTFLITFLEIRVQDILFKYFTQLKKEGKNRELLGIIWLCLAASLVLGLIVGVLVFFLSDWIAETFYDDIVLGNLIRIYSVSAVFSAFNSFYTAILRINNQFTSIVVPQLIGTAVDLLLVVFFIYGLGYITLEIVIYITTLDVIISRVPPLIQSFWIINQLRPSFSKVRDDIRSLQPMAQEVKHMFFHSNLAGYMKLSEGSGAFLLGLLSTPTQVALFGLSQKLLRPLEQLKRNLQVAITPEVHNLYAYQKYNRLNSLIKRYVLIGGGVSAAFFLTVALLIKPFIVLFAKAEYLEALPNFYLQLATSVIIFPFILLFPLTVTMNQIKLMNIVKALSFVYIGVACIFGLNAVSLAMAYLLGAITNKVFSDLVVYKRFLAEKSQAAQATTT